MLLHYSDCPDEISGSQRCAYMSKQAVDCGTLLKMRMTQGKEYDDRGSYFALLGI